MQPVPRVLETCNQYHACENITCVKRGEHAIIIMQPVSCTETCNQCHAWENMELVSSVGNMQSVSCSLCHAQKHAISIMRVKRCNLCQAWGTCNYRHATCAMHQNMQSVSCMGKHATCVKRGEHAVSCNLCHAQKHAISVIHGKTCNLCQTWGTCNQCHATCAMHKNINQCHAWENMQLVSSVGSMQLVPNVQPVPSAGTLATGAKEGEICNQL